MGELRRAAAGRTRIAAWLNIGEQLLHGACRRIERARDRRLRAVERAGKR